MARPSKASNGIGAASNAVPVVHFCWTKAPPAVGALWHHEVLPGWVGGLRAASRYRAASCGEGEHADNREQAHQLADPDQTVHASHAVLFQDGAHARSRHWAVHQALRIR